MGRKTERYGYRFLGENLRVSNDTRVTRLNNNDIVCGSSGSCKTGSIVYAQLKSLRDSSLIVADTKGRLEKMFRKELIAKGYRVRVLNLVNPEKSCLYNPLAYIRENGTGGYREQDIARLATVLVPSNLQSEDPFWELSARSVLELFISYTLLALPKEDHNMYTVSRLFRAFLKPMGEMAFLPWIEAHPESLAAKRYAQVKGMQSAEKMMSSIYAFVNLGLKPFDYEDYRNVFDPSYVRRTPGGRPKKREETDIAAIGKEKTVLFLNISDNDHSMDAMVNIFYTQALQTLISEADSNADGQLKVPVRIVMDDFASSAVIPDFDKIISIVRSRDIWLTLCIQSFTQLETLYTHSQALTIINNCDHIIYLGSNDLSSAQFIGTRALKTPEMVLCMDRDKEYVLEAGKPVSLVKKIPAYSFEEADDLFQLF
ncbi:MAG: type IV secretory system conjugative DNA transfer family protein [Lachnospiraceae bacterium]|nr:type IV secretory system conjugative DNA transfer family protein [Lachnospiraceae bacterium]